MSISSALTDLSRADLRALLEELHANYAHTLDDGNIEDWPNFFTEDCNYTIISSENHNQGLPLATMLCESKGYLLDRVRSVQETSMFAPRQLRHLISGLRITSVSADSMTAEASFVVFQTMTDQGTTVFMAGRYIDQLVVSDGQLLLADRRCIYDTNLVPNSLIYPL